MCICKVGCEEDEYWRNCEDPGEMIAKFRWVNPLGDKKFAEHQTEFRTRHVSPTRPWHSACAVTHWPVAMGCHSPRVVAYRSDEPQCGALTPTRPMACEWAARMQA